MGNLHLRKLIKEETIYNDSNKKYRHRCNFNIPCILKIITLDNHISYYEVLKCPECLSFKSNSQKGNVQGKIFKKLTYEQESLPLLIGKINSKNLLPRFANIKEIKLINNKIINNK